MKLLILFFSIFSFSLSQLISQADLLGVNSNSLAQAQQSSRFPYICGSDPFRFYSEFPCNMYPICVNGGFKINVGCTADYQCTPYAQSAVCVNNCCCTVPRIIGPEITTTRRFFDNSAESPLSLFFTSLFVLFVYLF